MIFKIEFIDIGRSSFSDTFEKRFDSLQDAEEWAYFFADTKLLSSNTSLEQTEERGIYTMYAGFRSVGTVIIEEVSDGKV